MKLWRHLFLLGTIFTWGCSTLDPTVNDYVQTITISDYNEIEGDHRLEEREYKIYFKISNLKGSIKEDLDPKKVAMLRGKINEIFRWLIINLPKTEEE